MAAVVGSLQTAMAAKPVASRRFTLVDCIKTDVDGMMLSAIDLVRIAQHSIATQQETTSLEPRIKPANLQETRTPCPLQILRHDVDGCSVKLRPIVRLPIVAVSDLMPRRLGEG
jgi:hypothetical protein